VIATLKLAVEMGFDDASALEDEEFNGVRGWRSFRGWWLR